MGGYHIAGMGCPGEPAGFPMGEVPIPRIDANRHHVRTWLLCFCSQAWGGAAGLGLPFPDGFYNCPCGQHGEGVAPGRVPRVPEGAPIAELEQIAQVIQIRIIGG
ncbi:MAG: hypothetical protein BWY80_01442 [Firmicutes bacterium ADurb.Bin456]|nr:MAG: hypothetical protein BWY80_01442 [Firmicutes bacterium ADurb.Bin456]